MYTVIDTIKGQTIDSEYEDFDDALARAEELAEEQARATGIDTEIISTFENGDNPRTSPRGYWEAGAGPEGDTCAYWPHVEWVD